MPKVTPENYYPTHIKFEVLPNKIYKITGKHDGKTHIKLLTKAQALKMTSDNNVYIKIREELVKAFERGDVK